MQSRSDAVIKYLEGDVSVEQEYLEVDVSVEKEYLEVDVSVEKVSGSGRKCRERVGAGVTLKRCQDPSQSEEGCVGARVSIRCTCVHNRCM
jgi:hypothetical protein